MKTEVVQQLHNKDEKKVILMRKSHSPHVVTFTPDPQDSHFVDVRIIRKATGEIRTSHYILRSDLATWIEYFESQGFTIQTTE